MLVNRIILISLVFMIILIRNSVSINNLADNDKCDAEIISAPDKAINMLVGDTLNATFKIKNVTSNCKSKLMTCAILGETDNLKQYIHIVNDEIFSLIIPNMSAMSINIKCKKENSSLGSELFSVRVGYKPIEVDFKCLSKNYENMFCEFEDVNNHVPQRYEVKVFLNNHKQVTDCKLEQNGTKKQCQVSMFRPNWPHTFEIKIINKLGNITLIREFSIPKIVYMNPPISVNVTNITADSALVRWDISRNFQVFNRPFIHRVRIKCNCTKYSDWIPINTTNVSIIDHTIFELMLYNLEYAYTWYDVQVSVRVQDAKYGDEQWSRYKGQTFRTSSRNPDSPPETYLGAFYIVNRNEATIFWKELDFNRRNGDNLTYEILEVLENGRVSVGHPKQSITKNTAKYTIVNQYDYEFKIISRNDRGRSSKYSIIRIPKETNRVSFPRNLKKILTKGIYTLTWERPLNYTNHITSYTILWCFPKDEQYTLCEKNINFTQINGSDTTFIYNNTEGGGTKIFAISANSYNLSSGLKWFPCSATNLSDMTYLPAMNEVLGDSSIKMSWTLPCDTTPLLQGFNISYCVVSDASTKETSCKSEEKKVFVPKKEDHYIIENLKPWTTYSLKIAMFNGVSSGPITEKLNTTQSGTPSPPLYLRIDEIKNTSISLMWKEPINWNGIPQHYFVYYNNQTKKVLKDYINEYDPKIVLKDLLSYTDYNIKIQACNDKTCSENSSVVSDKTKIGHPGKIEFPEDKNTDNGYYSWYQPKFLGGKLDFYEFRIEIHKKNDVRKETIYKLNRTSCTLNNDFCTPDVRHFRTYVRAVNRVPKRHVLSVSNNHSVYVDMDLKCEEQYEPALQYNLSIECDTIYDCLPSEWTVIKSTSCTYRSANFNLYILFLSGIIVSGFILIAMYCVTKRVSKMKNIKVELPTGLEDIDKEAENTQNILHNDDFRNDEQTERLLEKKSLPSSMISIDGSTETNGYVQSIGGKSDSEEEKDYSQKTNSEACLMPNIVNNVETLPKSPIPVHNTNPLNPPQMQPVQFPVLSNGYVSNAFMTASLNPQTHVTLPPISSDGYTPISVFLNQNKMEPKLDNNFKTPIVTSTNGISGYVTHKQLSDFHNTLMQ